jgi:glycosyltransferase involved in cell wall biosynthesis
MNLIKLCVHELNIRYGHRRFRKKNKEGLNEYIVHRKKSKILAPGITAVMRVRDEANFVEAAILSALRLADEVICVDNGSSDRTPEIIAAIASKDERVQVFSYPFECFASGPGHYKLPSNSVKSRSYFYNWAFSHANFSHVWKWDGDQIVVSDVKGIREQVLSHDIVHGCGIDLFSIDPPLMTKEPYTSNEPHFFRNASAFHYYMGEPCEFFSYPRVTNEFRKSKIANLTDPYFYHLKYANRAEIGKGWMEGWEKNNYFANLVNNRKSQGNPLLEDLPMEFLKISKK